MFTPITKTLRPDAKGRITLGSLGIGEVSSYHAYVDDQQRIVLEPFSEIPMREKWLFENKPALQKVKCGLKQSAAGKTHDLGSFARFLDK